MKRTIVFIAMFLFIAGFIVSCQKAEGAGGAKKQDTGAEVQMGIKQGGTGVVSEKEAAEQKSGKKEKPWKSWKYEGLLTEQDQEEFKALKKRWFGPGFDEADALRALKIFTKAKLRVEEIDAYPEPKGNQLWLLTQDFCEVVRYLAGRGNRDALKEFKKILRQCWDKPLEVECVLEVVGWYGDREVVPLLRRYVRYEWPRQYYASEDEEYVRQIKRYNERVRLKAAAALLALGDADTALPVLEELAKEGKTAALGYIFHNMIGTKWQARGIAIIRKALEYKNNESKALAALFLIRLTKEGYVKEDLNKLKEVLINLSEDILEKKKWDINIHGYNDRRVLGTVITALKELKSKEAIPVLERIANHPDASYLKQWVNEAIEAIDVSSSKKEGEDE